MGVWAAGLLSALCTQGPYMACCEARVGKRFGSHCKLRELLHVLRAHVGAREAEALSEGAGVFPETGTAMGKLWVGQPGSYSEEESKTEGGTRCSPVRTEGELHTQWLIFLG